MRIQGNVWRLYAWNRPEGSRKVGKAEANARNALPMLECAVKNKVDYCLGCKKFPCDIAYQEIPYSKKVLDIFKKFKEGK